MRFYHLLLMLFFISTAFGQVNNHADPFESFNRGVHHFNTTIDKIILKPIAILYKTVIPTPIRVGVNNAYNNVGMLPTIANDILQADGNYAIKDTWRFIINSTIGIAGVFDVASLCELPPHNNDLGITFAKWGDKNSPYIVIPFLGPSTIRDGMGLMIDYALFTPYPYIHSYPVLYSLLGLRYVDLRSQMLETDKIIGESLDEYAFIRDAYLQHRYYLIHGETNPTTDTNDLYVDEEETTSTQKKSIEFPLTTN